MCNPVLVANVQSHQDNVKWYQLSAINSIAPYPEIGVPLLEKLMKTWGITFSPNKCTGWVKKWFQEKGFGFITGSKGTDYFVHHSMIYSKSGKKSLGTGEAVEFDVMTGNDGRLRATNVTGPGGVHVKGNQVSVLGTPRSLRSPRYENSCARGGELVNGDSYRVGGIGTCFNFPNGKSTYGEPCGFEHELGGSSGVAASEVTSAYTGDGIKIAVGCGRGFGSGSESYYRLERGGGLGRGGVCFFFSKGFCSFGVNCRFKHE